MVVSCGFSCECHCCDIALCVSIWMSVSGFCACNAQCGCTPGDVCLCARAQALTCLGVSALIFGFKLWVQLLSFNSSVTAAWFQYLFSGSCQCIFQDVESVDISGTARARLMAVGVPRTAVGRQLSVVDGCEQ